MKTLPQPQIGETGFQIAPMIDVVFVIMLFFMVMAGAARVEKHLRADLPGGDCPSITANLVDEQIIGISEDGSIALNEDPMDGTGPDLPALKASLSRLKRSSDASNNLCAVSIVTEPEVKYDRLADVLNALSAARIHTISLACAETE